MTCSEFYDRFSEYFDGTADPSLEREVDVHLDACVDCRRYRDVVSRGAEILHEVPGVAVSEDFFPRLQHRIYHLEDGPALGKAGVGSATTGATALGIAMLIALAAWSPTLIRPPEVELPPIVVSRPEPRLVGVRAPLLWGSASRPAVLTTGAGGGLWDDPQLFTRYSPLSATRVRQGASLRSVDLER